MLNLIRSDFYKAFHMKSFKVICIVEAVIMLLMEGPLAGDDIMRVCSFNDIVGIACSTITLLFFSIFLSLFVTSEYKNGYIKNISGNVPDRALMLFSKLAVAFVVYWIFFFDILISTTLADLIFHKITFEDVVFSEIITQILVVFFLTYAVGSVIILMACGARNSGVSTTMAVMISGGLIVETINVFYMLLVIAGIVSFDANFDIYAYFLTPYINYYEPSDVGNACIAAACYLVGSVVLTILHLKKKDI